MSLGIGSIVSFGSPPASGTSSGGGSTSGVQKFAASFTGITSGLFNHNLGTLDIVVSVYDDSVPRREIWVDEIVPVTVNVLSVRFNSVQSGRVVVIG